MSDKTFFEKQTVSSRIKASIVSEYFPSYCKIIRSKHEPKEIRFIDLFSGPGIYEDNNPSTPILIARQCFNDTSLRTKVKLIFNDIYFIEQLKLNFYKEFPKGSFEKKPHFANRVVGPDDAINKFLTTSTHNGSKNESPAVLFIDPFGYKGIQTSILAEFLKNWGNEIFLFVNIKRIHPALENDKFEDLMRDLFPTRFEKLKNDRRYLQNTFERLSLIIDQLGQEFQEILKSKVYYTAFKFQEEDSTATSHYILHLTKGSRGYDLVKTIYTDFANVGTVFDGRNTYTFDAKQLDSPMQIFDIGDMNIDNLKDQIFKLFAGRTLSAYDLFEEHQVNSLYSRSHYTSALRKLVEEGKLSSIFNDDKRHKVQVLISKDCLLKFN